jgi:hypothetical protein
MTCPICGLTSKGTSPEQTRLDAIAVYVMELRRAHSGDERIGEICDQIELRAWGPKEIREGGELKGFKL